MLLTSTTAANTRIVANEQNVMELVLRGKIHKGVQQLLRRTLEAAIKDQNPRRAASAISHHHRVSSHGTPAMGTGKT